MAGMYAGLSAEEAAQVVMGEMKAWFGMDDDATWREVAAVLKAGEVAGNTMASLREVAQKAYREVMLRQAARFTQWEAELDRQGSLHFLDRAAIAIGQVKRAAAEVQATYEARLKWLSNAR